jgi:FAD:protein FMN transferase
MFVQVMVFLLCVVLGWSVATRHVQAREVEPVGNYQVVTHLTQDQALKRIFPSADEITEQLIQLNDQQAEVVRDRVGHRLLTTSYTLYIGKKAGNILGYAMIDEEIGKYQPITSMIGVSVAGKVLDVVIMVYRESRGGEVAHPRFRQQYRGKTSQDAIRVWRDIISISGATLSVRAVNAQVRKTLAIVDEVFLKEGLKE